MKLRTSRFVFTVFFVVFVLAIHTFALALDVPPLRARVNDLAGMLSPDRAQALDERLAAFERETGHQIAVLTIPSLQGDDLEGFSMKVAEAWKIGKKGFDNGAILLIARDDRKLRIEVGYGLEGVMPDAIASRIIREVITPRFKSGDYGGGIEAGIDAMLKITKGETLPERPRSANNPAASLGASIMTVLMITAMLALFIGLTRGRLLGGAFGGAASGLFTSLFAGGGALGSVLLPALIVGAVIGAIGATLGAGPSGSQWIGRPRNRRGDWGGGGFPGGFGGGGFGGGGGGGFGGGGGGFGGGGASGSW